MNPVSIGGASCVYETASKCEINRHWVDHQGLADVSQSLRALVQSLGTEVEDEFWQQVLGPVRRLSFALCSTPLPFDRAVAAACIDWEKLNLQVRRCQQLYPDSHAAVASVVQKLQKLGSEPSSPFTETLQTLHGQFGGMSVVLRNPRMHQAVASYFVASAGLRDAKVVSVRQLREVILCNVLVVIGPCGWFPDYVFSAPRTERIQVVSYRWIRDSWKPGPVFLNSDGSPEGNSHKHRVGLLPQMTSQALPGSQGTPDLEPLDLLPRLPPFDRASLRFLGMPKNPASGEETLPARLCHLSGGRAVFVSSDEGASSLVIDSSETDESVVKRIPTDELEPEQYLLLRTSGGGDFIASLADRILGANATVRRSQQAGWKAELMSIAQQRFGMLGRHELAARLAENLRREKLSEARPANVQYWMSSKCIHPRKKEDFAAILTFAGMQESTQALWEAMCEIDQSHRRAGHVIRRLLLQTIASSSLEPLERDGFMDFDLGEQDGGRLSAFQIMGISEEEFEIPVGHIGVLLDLEE